VGEGKGYRFLSEHEDDVTKVVVVVAVAAS
jgi:hypothetical protein